MKQVSTIRCVLYLRISLDRTGEGLAIERQRAACRRIALERGWIIVREYVDDSISAYKARAQRPGYDQMVKDYTAGLFDAIVVWDLDRLTRQPRQLEDWIDAAEDHGLRLVTANGEADLTTDAGKLFARIKAAVSRSESDRKGARQVAAARQRAENGHMPIGVRPFGYTVHDEIIESEAAIVREMFARFYAGDSLSGIARWMNETGVPTRHGGPWRSNSVRQILVNPRYAGRVVYKHRQTAGRPADLQSVPAAFSALVSEDIFDAVNDRLADPRRKTAFGTDRKHLGSSLFLCGVCGRPVRSHGAPSRYRCPDGHLTRKGEAIDGYVTEVIHERLRRPDLAKLTATTAGKEAATVAAEIRGLRARLRQTDTDYDTDVIDAQRWKVKKAKLQAELDQAEARRARILAQAGAPGITSAPDPVAAYDAAPLGVQRQVIGFFMTVTLLHVPRGVRGFSTDSVRIEGKDMT